LGGREPWLDTDMREMSPIAQRSLRNPVATFRLSAPREEILNQIGEIEIVRRGRCLERVIESLGLEIGRFGTCAPNARSPMVLAGSALRDGHFGKLAYRVRPDVGVTWAVSPNLPAAPFSMGHPM
jgi:hypothetical protein